MFTDEENIVQDIQVEEALGKSDHAVLHWRVVVEPDTICDRRNVAVKYNYWKGDLVSIEKHLNEIDWLKEMKNRTEQREKAGSI